GGGARAARPALAGQPQAAGADRVDDGRHAVPRHRHARARAALPEDPRGPREVAPARPGRALRRALPALPAGRLRPARPGDHAAPHPIPAVALEDHRMRFADPHLLWLLLAVPAAVLAYALHFAQRRRLLAKLGDGPLVAKMAGEVSVRRKI